MIAYMKPERAVLLRSLIQEAGQVVSNFKRDQQITATKHGQF
jgi:hypothetical protein